MIHFGFTFSGIAPALRGVAISGIAPALRGVAISGIAPALRGVATSILLVCAAAACGDDGSTGGTAGVGTAGTGFAGTGLAGTGFAGTMGMAGTMGTAGMVAGAGGMMGMAGAAGMAGSGATGAPTFSAIFMEIIAAKGCNGGPLCHGGAVGMLQMVDMHETYMALVNMPAMGMNLTGMPPHCANSGLMRVVPGNPDMSLLVQKIEQMMPPCGTVMPPNPPMLSEAERMQIRMWIANGAMEN